MKEVRNFAKKNYKLVVAFLIGVLLVGTGVYAATYINAVNVSYTNTTSGLSATNMQDALDEAYNNNELKNRSNIVAAYTYNASTCVTGLESTCSKTTCYKSTTAGSCPAGTIIQYKVNDMEVVTFHVMFDNGSTMTMQSQRNTISNSNWYGEYADTAEAHSTGPLTVLPILEHATKSWTNVNDQTYTMGTTVFKTNAYTLCSRYDSCTSNSYKLSSRTAKARMITVQEATSLGCTTTNNSCPIWMHNYLHLSTNNGGTFDDNNTDASSTYNNGYWTMNVATTSTTVWAIGFAGSLGNQYRFSYTNNYGARAVVVISK